MVQADGTETKRCATAARRRRKAMDVFKQIRGEDLNVRLPVNALAGLLDADTYEYVGEGCRKVIDDLSAEQKDSLTDYNTSPPTAPLSGIGGGDLDICDERGRVMLLYKGKPGKKEKQILFMLLCLASDKPQSEIHQMLPVRGPNSIVPETPTNGVRLTIESCTVLANLLYGAGDLKSAERFISDLKKLARMEFKIHIPLSETKGYSLETIPFSVAIVSEKSPVGENPLVREVIITLSDIFFYKNHHKYALFNIEDVLDGLRGRFGVAFAAAMSSFVTLLPAVSMRLREGKAYEASIQIDKIFPEYSIADRRARYKARKSLVRTSNSVGNVLACKKTSVSTKFMTCKWTPDEKNF